MNNRHGLVGFLEPELQWSNTRVASLSGVGVTPVGGRTAASCDDFEWFDLRFFVIF
jgi:hypothetical protein